MYIKLLLIIVIPKNGFSACFILIEVFSHTENDFDVKFKIKPMRNKRKMNQ